MGTPVLSPSPPPDRGMQFALGAVAGCLLALTAVRWFGDAREPRPVEVHRATSRVDLNKAGRSELMQLPGVGPGRADKILTYRQTHGGFRQPDELQSVEGIGPTTWRRLEPYVAASPISEPGDDEPVRLQRKPKPPEPAAGKVIVTRAGPIDLNSATAEQLELLPGIGKTLALRIIEQREREPFRKVEDLRRVIGIGVKTLEKVRPLVTVKEP